MKVHEIIQYQQLDEFNLKRIAKHAATVGIVGAAMMNPYKVQAPNAPQQANHPVQQRYHDLKKEQATKTKAVVERITKLYGINPKFAKQVINLAKKYEKVGFPTARDIIAVIAVESEFNPDAKSRLHHDPAIGLMQIRPKVWGVNAHTLKNPESAIKIGSDILNKLYRHLHGDKEAALQAYNVGLTNFQQGEENLDYVQKFYIRLKHINM
jgi:hypothetical protein